MATSMTAPGEKTAAQVEAWLVAYLRELGVAIDRIGDDVDAASLGLDSLELEQMVGDVERWLDRRIDLGAVLNLASLGGFVTYLADLSAGRLHAPADHSDLVRTDFERFVNPFLGERMRQMRFGHTFVKASGCYLEDAEGRAYLDFVAGYGALPFGHNPDPVWEAIEAMRIVGEPNLVQLSPGAAAGALARRLVELTPEPLCRVTFANSGAETVEAAIKLCRLATGRQGILSTHMGFHGKTLGALSATGNPDYQDGTGAPVPDFTSIPYDDLEALREALATRPRHYAAFIVEPIQGEGGVVVPAADYLQRAFALCREYGVLAVADEVQTGLGRTGALFASVSDDCTPDVLLLAKALSGGLVPIGACITTAAVYNEAFAVRHSSTFAGNALACRVALSSLALITRDDQALIKAAAQRGAYLRQGLEALQRLYPHTLVEVRGRGLMLGLRIGPGRPGAEQSFLDVAFEQGLAAPMVASFLLSVGKVRLVPTLNDSHVLRVQPPLTVTQSECDVFLEAVRHALCVLSSGDSRALVRGLLHGEKHEPAAPKVVRSAPSRAPVRFGFLIHPLTHTDYRRLDHASRALCDSDLLEVSDLVGNVLEPFVASEVRVRAPDGRVAIGDMVMVPRTGQQLIAAPEPEACRQVRAGVDLCVARGAAIVGLGGYTAVVTRGGHGVRSQACGITTGNAYTSVVACEAVDLALTERGLAWHGLNVAVIGATGSVGQAMAAIAAERCGRLLLVGNPRRTAQLSERRLRAAARNVVRHLLQTMPPPTHLPGPLWEGLYALPDLPAPDAPEATFEAVVDALCEKGLLVLAPGPDTALPFAAVVLIATSAPDVLFQVSDFRRDAIVCDVSRPANVSPALAAQRRDVLVIEGGLVRAPEVQGIERLDLGDRLMFACMAETVLLALAGEGQDFSLGTSISGAQMRHIRVLANDAGFTVGELQSFGKPLRRRVLEGVTA